MGPRTQTIEGVELRLTCESNPEQYEAYLGDEQVGYLRLRHGEFQVDVTHCGGRTVYIAEPIGDGEFEEGERQYYLAAAVREILKTLPAAPPAATPPRRTSDRWQIISLAFSAFALGFAVANAWHVCMLNAETRRKLERSNERLERSRERLEQIAAEQYTPRN